MISMRTNIIHSLQFDNQAVMKKADQLHDVLNNLIYEGKASLGKNAAKIEETIEFFRENLFPHMNCDETVIFPFVERHLPRYEQTIRFLAAEHRELQDNFESFECLYKEFKKEKKDFNRQKIIDKLRDKGIYLFCVIRNHLQGENESIYKAAQEQLNESEKGELLSKVKACSCARNYLDLRGKNRMDTYSNYEI
jgi:hemerythrin-like domain-containing protein